ncbi:MAG: hypothetical protein ACTSUD_08405 [Alphaproteobacteria bacterium]
MSERHTSGPSFTSGPDGIEFAETGERLVLRKRTYRSMDWAVIMMLVPGGLLVLILLGIGIANATVFAYSWWGESLFYLAAFGCIWFYLTRAFNRRTIMVTRERIASRDGPLWSLAGRLDVPVAEIGEFIAYGTKHITGNLTTYRWYHVALQKKDGARLKVFRKLADQEAATFVKAKIVAFLGGRGAGSP